MLAIVAMTLAGASLIANSTLAGSRVRPGPYTFSTDACVDLANEGMWKVRATGKAPVASSDHAL